VPGGDALGGELFYTTSLAASVPIALTETLRASGLRATCFINAGTLSGLGVPYSTLLKSTRLAVGAGVTYGTKMGKLEMTYSVPLRYGSRDVRKAVQFGFGFAFGG
jgi:outer membrane protein assembly factor BamA